jgi:hypothetical protein
MLLKQKKSILLGIIQDAKDAEDQDLSTENSVCVGFVLGNLLI